MALVESATVDWKDMQTTKCLVTKLPFESAVRSLVVHFVLGTWDTPQLLRWELKVVEFWIILRVSIAILAQSYHSSWLKKQAH